VLKGVSDWIVSRSVETKRGVEILRANGPAEVPEPPDNDAFTNINMVSGQILRRAIRAAEQLGHAVPTDWVSVEPICTSHAVLTVSSQPTTASGSMNPRVRRHPSSLASFPMTIR
jgi:hypothetical protein